MTNIGVDFALLDNRLSGSLDVYNKDTKGILISLPAPLEHGTSVVPNQNAGEVNNKGFELDLHWNDRIGSVIYNVGFNLGFVNNKVTKFQGDISSISGVYKIQEGRPSTSSMSSPSTALSATRPTLTMYSRLSTGIPTISPPTSVRARRLPLP